MIAVSVGAFANGTDTLINLHNQTGDRSYVFNFVRLIAIVAAAAFAGIALGMPKAKR